MQEEKQCAHADRPNHVRVRVFDKYCNGYKPVGSINKYLGGLGKGWVVGWFRSY
jgi:hypothetical protein